MNYIVIPAVPGGKRLPNKLTLKKNEKILLQYTWENCLKVPDIHEVIIATNDREIESLCKEFGATVVFESERTSCGTDLVVKTAKKLNNCNVVTNVQAEWPNIDPDDIFKSIELIKNNNRPEMSSLYYQEEIDLEYTNYNLVKVVVNQLDLALYFSRANVPYRSKELKFHIGVYSLNKELIQMYESLTHKGWNNNMASEDLEQLKMLNADIKIRMRESKKTKGVDTMELYEEFIGLQG